MKRNPLILTGILILLGIAAYFALNLEGEQSRESSVGEPLVQYDSAAVDKLEITANYSVIVLEKQAGKWMLTSPIRASADESAVAAAVGKGKDMKITNLASTNPGKQITFSVDSTATLVKAFANNAQVASFRVGKPANTWTETYVRNEGSDNVYSVEGTLGIMFGKAVHDWRDKTIFSAGQSTINEVNFRFPANRGSGDTTFTLARRDSVNWTIGSDAVENSAVTGFLNSLSNFQTDEFITSMETTAQDLAAIIGVNGIQVRFYKRSDNKYDIQTSATPQWFSVSEWKAGQILKRKKDFVPASTAIK